MTWDTEATRRALLDAAVAEFATHGLAGARVDRIARAARVNKERIYGYFGGKQPLFAAVLRSELARLAAAVPLEAGQDLGEYAGRVFDYHLEHPELLRLLHWEGLEAPGPPVIDEEHRAQLYAAKVDALRQGRPAEASGDGLDPSAVLYAVIALSAWWFAAPQVARMTLGPLADDPAAQRAALVQLARRLGRPAPDAHRDAAS